MVRKLSAFWQKLLERVVEAAIYISVGTLWRGFFQKKLYIFSSLLDIDCKVYLENLCVFLINFGHWVKSFWFFDQKEVWRGCQSCSLSVHINILRRMIYFYRKWPFLINFGYWAKSFDILLKNPGQVCHNCILHSTRLLEPCEEKIFSWENFQFFFHFRTLRQFFRFLSNFFTRVWQKCILDVQNNLKTNYVLRSFLIFLLLLDFERIVFWAFW